MMAWTSYCLSQCWPWSISLGHNELTHWGQVTHICVSRTITGSDNGLSPGRRQANIWTNAGILLIGPLGTNFSENSIEILTFSFTKMGLKVSSAKWRPFCLSLNVLTHWSLNKMADILHTFWNATAWKKILYFDSNFTKVYSYNKSALGQIMAWHQIVITWTNNDQIL